MLEIIPPIISAGKYLLIMIPSMILGVIGVNLLFNLGIMSKIVWIARPVTRFGNLSDQAGLSFITAFGSPTAANTILVDNYEKGYIAKREMYIASLTNSFPAILMHWKGMIPILIPLLGITGVLYFGILVLVGLVKTILVLIASRFLLRSKKGNLEVQSTPSKSKDFKTALTDSITSSKGIIFRILKITIPITLIVFILIHMGVFEYLARYLSGLIQFFPVPTEAIAIISAQFGHHIAGYTMASNFLTKGVLSGYQVIVILLIGNVVSSISSLRHYIPYYMGIFGPKLGFEIMLLATGIRQGLIIITILILLGL